MPPPGGQSTGHVRHPQKDHLIQVSARRHRHLAGLLAIPPPSKWDSWMLGWVGGIKDQSQCGSCWDFSGTRVVETAYNKAGVGGGPAVMILSEQYTLNCGRNGGCSGDDNVTVLDWAKSTGLPLSKDYGPYTASARGQCQFKPSMPLFKIDDWGFADGNGGNGVAPVAAIKAVIMQYGGAGSGVDAGFNDPGTGIISGRGHNIDHDVFISGWEDTATKVTATVASILPASVTASDGWWWMDNSWGTGWGDKGRARVQWGAYDLGTEAVWAVVNSAAPPIDYFW